MLVLQGMLKLVLALLVLLATAWFIARLAPAPATERAADAALTAPWQAPGSDAFDALFLVGYDVPPSRRRALVDADLQAGPSARAGDAASKAGFRAVAPDEAGRKRLCGFGADCIDHVAADREGLRALLARHAGLLRNLEGLRRHGHARGRMEAIEQPMPAYQHVVYAATTAHALRFLDGDADGAIAGACADVALWRRLAEHSDTLVGTLVAANSAAQHAALLAGVAARTPRGLAFPTACEAAVAAPGIREGDLARAITGEYRFQQAAFWPIEAEGSLRDRMLVDAEATRLRSAGRLVAFSAPAVRADLAADRGIRVPPASRPGAGDWRCIGNLGGCMLVEISGSPGAFEAYARRMQDHRARLQALAAVAWLRAQPPFGEPLQSRLARWPGQWPLPARQVVAGEDGRELRIPLFEPRGGPGYWSLPAPGSRVGASADAGAAAGVAPPAAPAAPADRLRRM